MRSMQPPSRYVSPSFHGLPFRKTKSGIKLQTLLDLQGNIPSFIEITDAKLSDVDVPNILRPEPGAV